MNWLTDELIAIKPRKAGVAGSFYPDNPTTLAATIDRMLTQAPVPPIPGKIFAMAVPHAGYEYSGPVAACAYATLKDRNYARVVVIAPSHYESFNFTSIYDGDAYETPLGILKVDKAFVKELIEKDSSLHLSSRGHAPTAAGAEHAIEVQLPWLQRTLGEFELVPVVMGDQSYEASRALGMALAKRIRKDEPGLGTLIVASSDLSHYHSYDEASRIDRKTLHAIKSWDYFSMARNFQARIWEACGGAPIVAAMCAAESLGANRAQVLKYANSGDVTGDRSHVVGYSAEVFVKTEDETTMEVPFSLSMEEKRELLNLARKSIEQAVTGKTVEPLSVSASEALQRECGAFVTLHEAGNLRGCIGFTSAVKPLYRTVWETAMLAARRDPRFTPVTAEELPRLELEISVLSPLRRVLNVERIEVGRHGLLMKRGDQEGLLLPQVPVEQHWDRQTFLDQTCIKAGMPAGSWREEETDIFSFTAIVFGEMDCK
jgi:hypothetical protein